MKYIIGLGNPGEKYKNTYHNIAWLIFDALGLIDWKFDKYLNAEFTGEHRSDEIFIYLKPQTFMNRSGEIIKGLKKMKDFSPENLIVIHDDIDLPFGKVKLSYNRGDGGHNGVKSIIQHLKSKKFYRIRIGVAKVLENGEQIKPNVLASLSEKEQKLSREKVLKEVEKILKTFTQKEINHV